MIQRHQFPIYTMIQHPSCSGSHPACTSKDKIKPRICDPHIRDTVHDSRVAVCGVLGTDSLTLTPAACKEQDGSGRRPLKPFNRASLLYPTSPHVLLFRDPNPQESRETSKDIDSCSILRNATKVSCSLCSALIQRCLRGCPPGSSPFIPGKYKKISIVQYRYGKCCAGSGQAGLRLRN